MKFIIPLISVLALSTVAFADNKPAQADVEPKQMENPIPNIDAKMLLKLHEATRKTEAAWTLARKNGKVADRESSVIVPEHWAEPIGEFKPIRVESASMGLLIILEEHEGQQKGLYFLSIESSVIPGIMMHPEVKEEQFHGLMLSRGPDGSLRFTRKLQPNPEK